MKHKIPKEKVKEILASVDLIDIASRYLKLTGNGNGKYAICPLHCHMKYNHQLEEFVDGEREKTPSLCFKSNTQSFYCYGCGQVGNAIHFIMKHEKISFVKAIRKLSNIGGVKIS